MRRFAILLALGLLAPAAVVRARSPLPVRVGGELWRSPAAHAARGTQTDAPLPLKPTRTIAFSTDEGTWMAPDLSPDGRIILFDLLGDIYALPVAGGTARPVLTGQAFEFAPVWSPDGRRFAFISDRSGSNNLWIADADGSDARQLSHDDGITVFASPAWSPDGRFVYASRMKHTQLAFELWTYDVAGGSGLQVTKAQPGGNEGWDDRHNALGAAPSPDGRFVYYATKHGTTWSDKPLPHWQIARRDLTTGAEEPVITAPGGAMRPALSHDGTRLAYASRRGSETGLRLRNLATGEDGWLAYPIDHDGQEGGYYADLVPRFTFTPDDKALIVAANGHLQRLTLADRSVAAIPFRADIKLAIGPQTRVDQPVETGPVKVRVIGRPVPSPDGRRVAFAALGRLYVMELAPGATPHALATGDVPAFEPAWSPDGATLAYVTWDARAGGQVWRVPVSGGAPVQLKPVQLTGVPAYYTGPAFSPDGASIVVARASQVDRLDTTSEIGMELPTDLLVIPVQGTATPRTIASVVGAREPEFDPAGREVRFVSGAGIAAVPLAGGAPGPLVAVRGVSGNQYFRNLVPATDQRLSPDGRWVLATKAGQAWLVAVPPRLGTDAAQVNLDDAVSSAVRLTDVGADSVAWADDGRTITWSLGASIRRIALAAVDLTGTTRAETQAERFDAVVAVPRDVPAGTTVLRGATAITMRPVARGDEVIPNADIVITGDRIVAIGPRGSVAIPVGAAIRDVAGKFVTPGFVDVHDHWFDIRRGLTEIDDWDFLATLAYGVTSGLDPQSFTTDVFTYQDMIDAGQMPGPRAFSTGPGVFVDSAFDTLDHARAVLTRYRDTYRTRNIKSYMVGGRRQRQIMVMAAKELGMMPTTEGASDVNLNLTHVLDGFAGNEHALPIAPLHRDVIELFARSGTAYDPTLVVLYGAGLPLAEHIIAGDTDDAKLRRFIPASVLEEKTRGQRWTPPVDRAYPRFAAQAVAIQRAGGLVGMGSHGNMPGIGYLWELQAFASGGATPREVLRAATIDGATVIGRAGDIGSLAPGKLADLLVFDADPLADVKNTSALAEVVKGGRGYDAASLAELWPRIRPAPVTWFMDTAPKGPALTPP